MTGGQWLLQGLRLVTYRFRDGARYWLSDRTLGEEGHRLRRRQASGSLGYRRQLT